MDAVEDIKSRLSLEDVVSEYIQLKPAGRNMRGLSPFTQEKTPSFMVSPEKQIWHDFSSSKGGNIFSFVMEMEGMDFKAALEHLARKAGIDLSQYRTGSSSGNSEQKKRLSAALELAAKFYQVQLKNNPAALEYVFKKRRFNKQTALDFRIGYSPDGYTTLADFLKSKGYKDSELQQAGLTTKFQKGPIDMFRGRIMVPLMDPFGAVIGFTARLLNDDPKAPKYINTPGTILYDKSSHIFGQHLAKDAIRRQGFVVVVEGNLDVIASHQVGVSNVVATAGTALTTRHLKALSRISQDVRLCFDTDTAGLTAAERAVSLAAVSSVNLSIIELKDAKDPDELIVKDAQLWKTAVETKIYGMDWLINRLKDQHDISTAPGKKSFATAISEVISKLADEVEREHYAAEVARLLGVSASALGGKIKNQPTTRLKTTKAAQVTDLKDTDALRYENQLVALVLINQPARGAVLKLEVDMLISEPNRQILKFLKSNADFDYAPKKSLPLPGVDTHVKILELLFEELYSGVDPQELKLEANRLKSRVLKRYIKQQKANLSAQLDSANTKKTEELLEQVKKLDSILKNINED